MKPISERSSLWLTLVLAAVMIATRFKHFGDVVHLPDASMALFFLGGLWVRRHLAFIGLVVLAVAIDEVSVHYLGISDFCMTPAYAFLPLAYAVLWYAGRRYASTPDDHAARYLLGAFALALVAASASFAISNGAFYWLGGRYAQPHMSEYLARLWQWGPLFVRTTMSYVAVALLAQGVWMAQRRAGWSRA